ARAPATARLRAEQADRVTLTRRAALPRRLPLSAPLPHAGSRLDRRTLGGEGGGAPAPLLPHHRRGAGDAQGTSQELEGVRDGHHPDRGDEACLTGARRFGRDSCLLPAPRRRATSWISSRSSRSISNR